MNFVGNTATNGTMPKVAGAAAPYAEADKKKIADWIAAGMQPGAPALIPDPNAIITSDIALMFSANMGTCVNCHGNSGNINLTGNANLKAGAVQSLARLNAAANGDAGPMPPAGAVLNAQQLLDIQTWIDNGMPDVAPMIPDPNAQ